MAKHANEQAKTSREASKVSCCIDYSFNPTVIIFMFHSFKSASSEGTKWNGHFWILWILPWASSWHIWEATLARNHSFRTQTNATTRDPIAKLIAHVAWGFAWFDFSLLLPGIANYLTTIIRFAILMQKHSPWWMLWPRMRLVCTRFV